MNLLFAEGIVTAARNTLWSSESGILEYNLGSKQRAKSQQGATDSSLTTQSPSSACNPFAGEVCRIHMFSIEVIRVDIFLFNLKTVKRKFCSGSLAVTRPQLALILTLGLVYFIFGTSHLTALFSGPLSTAFHEQNYSSCFLLQKPPFSSLRPQAAND